MNRDDTPEPVFPTPAYGVLRLLHKSSGAVAHELPIDKLLFTIGRDLSCSLRMHYDTISRIHVEIETNLVDQTATLRIISSNGINFKEPHGSLLHLKKGTSRLLHSGDTLSIHKRHFVYEPATSDVCAAASALEPSAYGTPVRQAPGTPGTPAGGRRLSRRLSIFPSNKLHEFVPLSPVKSGRRQSGRFATPKKSGLSAPATSAVPEVAEESAEGEEEEAEDLPEGIVEFHEMEGGDCVIVEERDEDPAPFTPSKRREPALSAAQTLVHPSTPSRVPAKIALATPKGRMSLLKHTVLQSARKNWIASRPTGIDGAVEEGSIEVRRKSTSPKRAMGSMSPKAAEVVEEQDEPSDEEEDDDDEAEADALVPASHEHEDVQQENGQGELQWVYENGQEQSFESDSAEDSYEADMSLDVPEEVLDMRDEAAKAHDEQDERDLAWESAHDDEGENEGNSDEDEDEPVQFHTPISSRLLEKFYTPQVTRIGDLQPRRSLAEIGGPAMRPARFPITPNPLGGGAYRPTPNRRPAMDTPELKHEPVERKPVKAEMALGTPSKAAKALNEAQLAEIKKRRQSLATPRHASAMPDSFREPVRTPFSFARASHPALEREDEHDDDIAHDDEDEAEDTIDSPSRGGAGAPGTPLGDIKARLGRMRRESMLRAQNDERSKDRRGAVGFALPATPLRAGAGKTMAAPAQTANPVRVSRMVDSHAYATPSRATRALYPAFGKPDVVLAQPKTPVLEAQEDEEGESAISSLRTTPAKPIGRPAGTTPGRKIGTPFKLLRTAPEEQEVPASPASAGPSSPMMAKRAPTTPSRASMPPSPAPAPGRTGVSSITAARATAKSLPPKTPNFTGLREMMNPKTAAVPPKTPNFAGIRRLFPEAAMAKSEDGAAAGGVSTPKMDLRKMYPASPVARKTETPVLGAVRRLYPALPSQVEVATPDMRGLRGMYAPATEHTHGLGPADVEGVGEMFASPMHRADAVGLQQEMAEEEDDEEEDEAERVEMNQEQAMGTPPSAAWRRTVESVLARQQSEEVPSADESEEEEEPIEMSFRVDSSSKAKAATPTPSKTPSKARASIPAPESATRSVRGQRVVPVVELGPESSNESEEEEEIEEPPRRAAPAAAAKAPSPVKPAARARGRAAAAPVAQASAPVARRAAAGKAMAKITPSSSRDELDVLSEAPSAPSRSARSTATTRKVPSMRGKMTPSSSIDELALLDAPSASRSRSTKSSKAAGGQKEEAAVSARSRSTRAASSVSTRSRAPAEVEQAEEVPKVPQVPAPKAVRSRKPAATAATGRSRARKVETEVEDQPLGEVVAQTTEPAPQSEPETKAKGKTTSSRSRAAAASASTATTTGAGARRTKAATAKMEPEHEADESVELVSKPAAVRKTRAAAPKATSKARSAAASARSDVDLDVEHEERSAPSGRSTRAAAAIVATTKTKTKATRATATAAIKEKGTGTDKENVPEVGVAGGSRSTRSRR